MTVRLGVSLKSEIQHAVSSLSYWHMARTPVTQQALNNTWLAAQGLLNARNLWCKARATLQKEASSRKPAC